MEGRIKGQIHSGVTDQGQGLVQKSSGPGAQVYFTWERQSWWSPGERRGRTAGQSQSGYPFAARYPPLELACTNTTDSG
jgi:hypothetical protein